MARSPARRQDRDRDRQRGRNGVHAVPINDPTLNIGCGTGSWSPDGKRLACETWDDSKPARNGVYTISSADGSGLTRITLNPLGGRGTSE